MIQAQILKIPGVTIARLARLHKFLGSERSKTSLNLVPYASLENPDDGSKLQCRLLKSELNVSFDTYTVEVQVPFAVSIVQKDPSDKLFTGTMLYFIPISFLQGVYRALGIFPQEMRVGMPSDPDPLWEGDENKGNDEK